MELKLSLCPFSRKSVSSSGSIHSKMSEKSTRQFALRTALPGRTFNPLKSCKQSAAIKREKQLKNSCRIFPAGHHLFIFIITCNYPALYRFSALILSPMSFHPVSSTKTLLFIGNRKEISSLRGGSTHHYLLYSILHQRHQHVTF